MEDFLRALLVLLLLGATAWRTEARNTTWTWISGNITLVDQYGVYGQRGVPSILNRPGSRRASVSWFDDSSQEMWLFGGFGFAATGSNGYLNDLWRYKIAENTWTWMAGSNLTGQDGSYGTQGLATPGNRPGGRQNAVGWFDRSSRDLWLFGGSGFSSGGAQGLLNDLWKYSVNGGNWAWMACSYMPNVGTSSGQQGVAAASNCPGSREGSTIWFDESTRELWLLGGNGYGSAVGWLNDMWRYPINNSTWIWMSGSNASINVGGSYGQLGVPNVANRPGARGWVMSWYQSIQRELWLFGGQGMTGSGAQGYLNDFWRYRMNDSTWTWMSGNDIAIGLNGVYGERGVANSTNCPGSRQGGSAWLDSASEELILFGGIGWAASGPVGMLNDLWVYRLRDRTWVWIAGRDSTGQLGVYIQPGVTNSTTYPGARYYAAGWFDPHAREMWLFSGLKPAPGPLVHTNDLWRGSLERTGLLPCRTCSDSGCFDNSTVCEETGAVCIGAYCLKRNGASASSGDECASGIVSDSGQCCNTSCGICNFCAQGYCMPLIDGSPESRCAQTTCAVFYAPGRCWNGACDVNATRLCEDCTTQPDTCTLRNVPTILPPSSSPLQDMVPQEQVPIDQGNSPSLTPTAAITPRSGDLTPSKGAGVASAPSVGLIVGIVVPIIVISAGIVIFILVWRARRSRGGASHKEELSTSGASSVELSERGMFNIPASELKFGRQLGEGSYGAVYEGTFRDRPVAIKQLNGVTNSAVGEFFREASIMMSVPQHDNVVQMIGMCQQQKFFSLVMELVPAGSLISYLRDKGKIIDDEEAKRLCRGIASGMACLASQNVVHRDLAARNILLAKDFTPKVSDFGFSRVVGDDGVGQTATDVGPIRWMAPEALRSNLFSEKSDSWSFGCLMVELFTQGNPPFEGLDIFSVAVKVRDEGQTPEIPPSAPQWAQIVMTACFRPDPQHRPTFREICSMLK